MSPTRFVSPSTRVVGVPDGRRQAAGLASATALLVVAVLTGLSWHGHVAAVDRAATSSLLQASGSGGFTLAKVVSLLGSGPVVAAIALAVGAAVWHRTRDAAAALVTPIAAGAGGVVELVAKHLVARPRPATAWLTGESGNGFPSGHATGFTAMAVAACTALAIGELWPRRRGLACWVAGSGSAVVALARVAVGAHYVFDAAAGVLLGVVCALSTAQLLPLLHNRVSPILRRAAGKRRR